MRRMADVRWNILEILSPRSGTVSCLNHSRQGRKANAAQGMVPHQLVAKRCEFPPSVLNGPKLGTATSLGGGRGGPDHPTVSRDKTRETRHVRHNPSS